MKDLVVNNTVNYITKYYNYEGKEYDRLKYGLYGLYSLFTKTVVILIIAYFLSTIKPTLMFIFFMALLRTFSFGIHASKSLYCWLTTVPIYTICPLLFDKIVFNDISKIILAIIALTTVILFVPADTAKKPLKSARKRKIGKIATFILCVLYLVSILFYSNQVLNNSLAFSLILLCILVNPLTYKIFKMPYNNYKKFL